MINDSDWLRKHSGLGTTCMWVLAHILSLSLYKWVRFQDYEGDSNFRPLYAVDVSCDLNCVCCSVSLDQRPRFYVWVVQVKTVNFYSLRDKEIQMAVLTCECAAT